jgi:hypothetical protein
LLYNLLVSLIFLNLKYIKNFNKILNSFYNIYMAKRRKSTRKSGGFPNPFRRKSSEPEPEPGVYDCPENVDKGEPLTAAEADKGLENAMTAAAAAAARAVDGVLDTKEESVSRLKAVRAALVGAICKLEDTDAPDYAMAPKAMYIEMAKAQIFNVDKLISGLKQVNRGRVESYRTAIHTIKEAIDSNPDLYNELARAQKAAGWRAWGTCRDAQCRLGKQLQLFKYELERKNKDLNRYLDAAPKSRRQALAALGKAATDAVSPSPPPETMERSRLAWSKDSRFILDGGGGRRTKGKRRTKGGRRPKGGRKTKGRRKTKGGRRARGGRRTRRGRK